MIQFLQVRLLFILVLAFRLVNSNYKSLQQNSSDTLKNLYPAFLKVSHE